MTAISPPVLSSWGNHCFIVLDKLGWWFFSAEKMQTCCLQRLQRKISGLVNRKSWMEASADFRTFAHDQETNECVSRIRAHSKSSSRIFKTHQNFQEILWSRELISLYPVDVAKSYLQDTVPTVTPCCKKLLGCAGPHLNKLVTLSNV